ncbi:MAG: penicillin-binding protein activator LpoB [Deltaproteobacteria bacterium]|nr:penicillin-binding protein activator LpoB [Deltaproteobacteria bacterium]
MSPIRSSTVLACAVALTALTGCPSGPSTSVVRTNPNAQVDLSGNWNDTDANQVAAAMIRDCLTRPWTSKFKAEKGRDPVVKLYPIRNRSSEHINTKFYTKQVEMELLNSGAVKVVAALEEAGDARYEKMEQSVHASDETAKQHQKETGTDFLLNGWIVSQNDAVDGQEVRAYVTTMELINAETQEKVWIKVHQIKKVITRQGSQW